MCKTLLGGPGTSPSSSLQEIGLRILSMEVCRQAYGSFLPSTFSEEQYICAGTIGGGVDTCAVSCLRVCSAEKHFFKQEI